MRLRRDCAAFVRWARAGREKTPLPGSFAAERLRNHPQRDGGSCIFAGSAEESKTCGSSLSAQPRPASVSAPCGLWKPSRPGAPVQTVAKRTAPSGAGECRNRGNLPGSRSVRGPRKKRQCLDLLTGSSQHLEKGPQVTGKVPLPLASEGGASPGAGPLWKTERRLFEDP